jgi:hypothetical protein
MVNRSILRDIPEWETLRTIAYIVEPCGTDSRNCVFMRSISSLLAFIVNEPLRHALTLARGGGQYPIRANKLQLAGPPMASKNVGGHEAGEGQECTNTNRYQQKNATPNTAAVTDIARPARSAITSRYLAAWYSSSCSASSRTLSARSCDTAINVTDAPDAARTVCEARYTRVQALRCVLWGISTDSDSILIANK